MGPLGLSSRHHSGRAEAVLASFSFSPPTVSRRLIRASGRPLPALCKRSVEGYKSVDIGLDGKTFIDFPKSKTAPEGHPGPFAA